MMKDSNYSPYRHDEDNLLEACGVPKAQITGALLLLEIGSESSIPISRLIEDAEKTFPKRIMAYMICQINFGNITSKM